MKKTTTKKLSLSRETVGNLDGRELTRIAGGIISSDNKACTYTRIPETSCYC